MKARLALIFATTLLSACQYDESIADSTIKPSGSLVGKWQITANDSAGKSTMQSISIQEIPGNLLLIDHQYGDKHWFFYGRGVFADHPEILELEYYGQGPGLPCETSRYAIVLASASGDSLRWYALEKNRLDPGKGGPAFRKELHRARSSQTYIFETQQTYQRVIP